MKIPITFTVHGKKRKKKKNQTKQQTSKTVIYNLCLKTSNIKKKKVFMNYVNK